MQAGKKYTFGQGIGIARELVVADTDEERCDRARPGASSGPSSSSLCFNAALARSGENYKDVPNTFESMCDRGLTICGSPDTVSRKLDALFKDLPAEYFWAFTYNELVPQKALMRSFELLTTKVLPRFSDSSVIESPAFSA